MNSSEISNQEQQEFWSREGEHWVVEADRYDAMNREFGEAMLASADLQRGETVLDVGCGNGATTIAAAGAVAPGGTVTGIDVAPAMLGLARQRANEADLDNVDFVEGDAQVHPFEDAAFDAVLSRFGTMFFADPAEAFSNLARALKPKGRLTIVVWQDMLQSEWILVPGAAAAEHVGLPDFGPPGAPGPFALADRDRVEALLADAGFGAVTIEPVTRPMRIGDDVDDVTEFITSLELVRDNLFAGKPEDKVRAAIEAARNAIAPYATPDGVMMSGSAWLVFARR